MEEIISDGYATVVKIPRVIDRLGSGMLSRGTYGRIMADWLEDHIGPGKPGLLNELELIDDYHFWYSQVWFGYIVYHFRREQDATLFNLKWG